MTDPVQVLAEASCIYRPLDHGSGGRCNVLHPTWTHPECAVAALQAAGALMPAEAVKRDEELASAMQTKEMLADDIDYQAERIGLLVNAGNALQTALRLVLPGTMGGTPDLFAPDVAPAEDGDRWDAWETGIAQPAIGRWSAATVQKIDQAVSS